MPTVRYQEFNEYESQKKTIEVAKKDSLILKSPNDLKSTTSFNCNNNSKLTFDIPKCFINKK